MHLMICHTSSTCQANEDSKRKQILHDASWIYFVGWFCDLVMTHSDLESVQTHTTRFAHELTLLELFSAVLSRQ